jgi:aspartyl aminopeptidase
MGAMIDAPALAAAQDLLAFVDASPTPYHAVAEVARRLASAGFAQLNEADAFQLAPGQRFFVTRGGGSIAAFVVGERPPHEAGFQLVGAHTDSPNLRLRPLPDVRSQGYHQLAVEPYGGLLLTTWLDRDLSIAGRVVLDDGSPGGRSALVDFGRPLARIPNLAIHLNRNVNTDGLKLNPQTQMLPLLGLCEPAPDPDFLELLAAELARAGIRATPASVVGFDLCVYDTQKAALIGARDELLAAGRLDNLASCHAATRALCGARGNTAATRGMVLYDHEEVGSRSAQGAASPFLPDLLGRITGAFDAGAHDALPRAVARSLLISADMAHGVHPSYADKHEPSHRPVLGRGPVLKTNVAMSYASDAESTGAFRLLCQRAGVVPQQFVSRADVACGSTIGPITAGRVGLKVVDIGNPLLSMHSAREVAGTADVAAMIRVLEAFFA